MVASGISGPKGSHRARKPARRSARTIAVIERDGQWHVQCRIRAGGRSVRIRRSLGLSTELFTEEQAIEAARDHVEETTARANGKVRLGAPVAIAALEYLKAPRQRPLGFTTVYYIKLVAARFSTRRLNEIPERDWLTWVDGDAEARAAGLSARWTSATRERFLNALLAFLTYCKGAHGLAKLPVFRRDRKAINPNRRKRRRVLDLRPDLLQTLFEAAHIAIRAQLVVECDTGARVSSILHGARVCDLDLTPGREAITFLDTKPGHDVHAVLSAGVARTLKEYLMWRGALHDREAPLFLTPDRKPYSEINGRYGNQNKRGFASAKRRAIETIRQRAASAANEARRRGDRLQARAVIDHAKADADLLSKVTQHWFRHRLATLWIRKSPRAAMGQGGWLDIRSLMGYAQDAPEFSRSVALEYDPTAKPTGS